MNMIDYTELKNSLHVSKYDSLRYVLNNGGGRYYLVNEKTQKLVSDLKKWDSWEEAHQHFSKNENEKMPLSDFKEFIHALLHLDTREAPPPNKTFLRLRLKLVNKELSGSISSIFTFLFRADSFFYLFGLFVLMDISFLLITRTDFSISGYGWEYAVIVGLYVFSVILHEFGHIAACRKFGARHGGVGVGFYFVIPVFWADVNGLWMLPRKKRIITNLAGIHIQLFLSVILIAAYFVTGTSFLLVAADLITLTSLLQLWPFMRYDGYWILSDSFETPNLMKTSMQGLKELALERIGKIDARERDKKEWLIILYAFSNAFLTILYIVYVLVNNGELLIHYPTITWKLTSRLVYQHTIGVDALFNFSIVTLFYYIILKKSLKVFLKLFGYNKRKILGLISVNA